MSLRFRREKRDEVKHSHRTDYQRRVASSEEKQPLVCRAALCEYTHREQDFSQRHNRQRAAVVLGVKARTTTQLNQVLFINVLQQYAKCTKLVCVLTITIGINCIASWNLKASQKRKQRSR